MESVLEALFRQIQLDRGAGYLAVDIARALLRLGKNCDDVGYFLSYFIRELAFGLPPEDAQELLSSLAADCVVFAAEYARAAAPEA